MFLLSLSVFCDVLEVIWNDFWVFLAMVCTHLGLSLSGLAMFWSDLRMVLCVSSVVLILAESYFFGDWGRKFNGFP